jgi:GNAT superfamily N-acetyltransferase
MFRIRPLEYRDLEYVRLLRNHYREHFFTTTEITPAQQEAWWYAAAYGDQRWVIEESVDGLLIGYFSIIRPKSDLPVFPSERHVYYFSTMMVDPDYRGRGAILAARGAFDPATPYIGYVPRDNESALRACHKLGFATRGLYHHIRYGPIIIVWKDWVRP